MQKCYKPGLFTDQTNNMQSEFELCMEINRLCGVFVRLNGLVALERRGIRIPILDWNPSVQF